MKSLKAKIKDIYSSEFFKHSTVLLSSNAISQFIAIIVYPFITRIYSREAFGEFNLFLSIVGILTLLTTGKYELAIVLPKAEKKAAALFQLSFLLTVFVSVLAFILIFFRKESIASFFHQENLVPLLSFLPFYLLMGGLWQTLNYYFIRQKKYYNISAYNIIQSSTNSLLKCLFGLKGFLQYGLVWGQFAGQLSAILTSVVAGRKAFKSLKHWKKHDIIQVAKTYSNFPKFELFREFINSFAGNLPVLLLSVYFGMGEIGLFALALSIGFRPVNLFSNSVCQVLFKRTSEQLQNKRKIKKDLWMFCKTCICVLLPFFILLFFVSDELFEFLFSSKWKESGFYLKLMLPWLFLVVLEASMSFIPDLFFKQKTALNIEFMYLILRVFALAIGIRFHHFDLAIGLYCGVSACVLLIKLIWYSRLIKKYELSL
jgi:O-antigen/teichoic acid export membrane protein